MKLELRSLGLGSLVGALGATALYAAAPAMLPAGDRAAMEQVVRDYILAHPEIVTEALQRAEANAVASNVQSRRAELETPYRGAVAGDPAGDVTLVEFYDYACGYCRQMVKDVDRLVAEDPRLRVVYRELPILSAESDRAARSSLSAAASGKFLAFHHAMYSAGRVNTASIATVEKTTGTPPPPARDPAHDAEIGKNVEIARALQVSGTPAFVVGGRVLNGAVGYDRLKQAIAEARAKT